MERKTNSPEIHKKLADLLLEIGCLEEAIAEYHHALEIKPDCFWSYYNLAQALLKLEKWEESATSYRNAININPDFPWSYYSLGDALFKLNQWELAAAAYRKAIELNPDFFGSYHNLGDVLFKQEKWQAAVVAYRQASELNSDFFWSHYNLGESAFKLEKWEEAAIAYHRAIEIDPNHAQSYYNLSATLLKLEKWEEATSYSRRAINLNPENHLFYYNLSIALIKLKEWEESAVACHRSIELEPNFSWSYYNLGEVLLKLEKWEEAVNAYRQASQLNPDFSWSFYNLGEALLKLEKWEEAITAYRRSIQLNPNFALSYYNLGECLTNSFTFEGKENEAVFAYYKAIQLDPNLPEIKKKLANALLKRDEAYLENTINIDDIIPTYYSKELLEKKLLKLDPEDADIYFQLANIIVIENQLEAASILYKRALQTQLKSGKTPQFLKQYLEIKSAKIEPPEARDRYLTRVVPGKTFAEVGGLWGTINERVSIAHQYGAVALTMIDTTPLESPLWQVFRDRIANFHITQCTCICRDISQFQLADIDTPYDVVHCAGVFYHHPHPIQVLAGLRQITKEYLILTSAITPEVVENEQGRYQIPPSAVLFIPALNEAERAILKADWEKYLLKFGTAPGITEKVVFHLNNFTPWWWLPTATSLKSMCEIVGFEVIDSDFAGHERSLTLLLKVKI